MSKELYFFGGSKGVGKTSVTKEVSRIIGADYVNTGDLVRADKENFERSLFCTLMSRKGKVVIDTHYARSSRSTPYDFEIGLSEGTQEYYQQEDTYTGAIFLLEASHKIVLDRRVYDGDRKRCFEKGQIKLETEFNHAYSQIYADKLNLPRYVINNDYLSIDEVINKIVGIIQDERRS